MDYKSKFDEKSKWRQMQSRGHNNVKEEIRLMLGENSKKTFKHLSRLTHSGLWWEARSNQKNQSRHKKSIKHTDNEKANTLQKQFSRH